MNYNVKIAFKKWLITPAGIVPVGLPDANNAANSKQQTERQEEKVGIICASVVQKSLFMRAKQVNDIEPDKQQPNEQQYDTDGGRIGFIARFFHYIESLAW